MNIQKCIITLSKGLDVKVLGHRTMYMKESLMKLFGGVFLD